MIFYYRKPAYENALHKSSLKYLEEINQYNSRRRTQNIIWFNPPFSQTVKTNVAKLFFRLLDKHFPKFHSLYKIFNRNIIIVSYSCMNLFNQKEKQNNSWNFRNKNECPLKENCRKLSTNIRHSIIKLSLGSKREP